MTRPRVHPSMRRYAKFNATGKRLDKRLEMLGGQRLVPLGLGDDQDANGEKAPRSQKTPSRL